jgi:hypothetical protein
MNPVFGGIHLFNEVPSESKLSEGTEEKQIKPEGFI